MTIPYNSSGLFNEARVLAAWRTYPLQNMGSPNASVYNMRCSQRAVDYTKPALNATMNSEANAQVIALPWTNGAAYFVGDFNHQSTDGGMVQFTRRFATKPETSTERLVGSRSFPFPGRQFIRFIAPNTADDATVDQNLYRKDTNAANTKPGPLYETRQYWVNGVDTAPTVPDVFKPTLDGGAVDFVRDSAAKTFTDAKALDGDTFSAAVTVAGTVPTLSEYETNVSDKDLVVVDVSIETYLGNIFVQRTFKMTAQ